MKRRAEHVHGDECGRCCPNRGRTVEVSTVGFDPDREGIGSGPSGGSNAVSSRLFIPEAPTPDNKHRYSFVLCGYRIPRGTTAHLLGWAQKLVIGQPLQTTATIPLPEDFPVVTPDWAFRDGNVVWSLRFIPGNRKTPRLNPPPGSSLLNRGPSKTTNPYGAYSALLYRDQAAVGYTPPAGGNFYGDPIFSPGTFYDVRNPWRNYGPTVDIPIDGPGDLIMVASVWQTNPATRPVFVPPPGPFDVGSLEPEERFLLSFPDAVYRGIAGHMLVRQE